MADGPIVNGGILPAKQPPRQGFDQVILQDLGDLTRGVGRTLGITSAPNPPRTPVQTPGPLVNQNDGSTVNASVNPNGSLVGVGAVTTPSPEELSQQQQQNATVQITPTWKADP